MTTIKIELVVAPEAKVPAYAHEGDAGMDLFSTAEITLKPMQRALIPTGIRAAIPKGYEAQIRPKSGLAINHGISLVNTPGTIDSGFRGEIKVIMINFGDEPYTIRKGSKIAQMVIAKVESVRIEKVDSLDKTSRNEGGFGSTGSD